MNLLDLCATPETTAPLSPLLLSYTITPGSVPTSSDLSHPVTANLTFSVTNGTGQAVKCAAIAFVLPVGTGAGELTATPGAIMASPAAGTTWTIAPDAQVPGSFTATPSGDVTLAPHASLAFELSGVLVNGETGLVALSLYEASDFAPAAGGTPTKRQGSLLLTKANTGLAITSFGAAPWSVTAGQPCVLSWQATAADSCVLSWDGGNHAVPTSGTQTVHPALTTPYTLTAIGGGGSVTSQITVSVPVQVSFNGPTGSVKIGGPATLNWQIAGATTGLLSPVENGQDPVVGPSDSREVHPQTTTTYTLTASASGGGTVSAPVTVVVDPIPRIDCFKVSAPSGPALPGSAFTLSWQTNGLTVTIDQGIGPVDASGSLVVQPTETTTYTLTCANHNGPVTSAVTAQVLPPNTILMYGGASSDGSGNTSIYYAVRDQVHYELDILGFYSLRGDLPAGPSVVEFQLPPTLKGDYHDSSIYVAFSDAQGHQTTTNGENALFLPAGTPPPSGDASLTQIQSFWTAPDPWVTDEHTKLLSWRFTGASEGVLDPGGIGVGSVGQCSIDSTVAHTLTVKGGDGRTAVASLVGLPLHVSERVAERLVRSAAPLDAASPAGE